MSKFVQKKALKILKKYNQQEIINLLNILTDDEKERLYSQIIKLDFKQIVKLYNELNKKEKVSSNNIQEITALNKDKLSKEELEEYDVLGEEIIKNNKYALVTMSGRTGNKTRI